MSNKLRKALIALCSMTLAVTAGAIVGCKPKGGTDSSNDSTGSSTNVESSVTSDETSVGGSEESSDETSEGGEGVCAHSWGEPVVVNPTCTVKGSSTITCSLCGDTQVTKLDATGHTYTLSKEVTATCTLQGYNEYACACGDSYTEITADKKGHDTLNAVWTVVGEEQVDGCVWAQIEEATCADCKETVTHSEEFEKHEYVVSITDGNCTEDGVKTYNCKCGANYEETFKNENGHAWVAGNVDTATGITTWTCSHNGAHTKTSFSAKDMAVATIPAEAIKDAEEIELQNATLQLPQEVKDQLNGEVELSVDTLDYDAKEEATATLTEEEKAKLENTPIFNFNMTQGTDAVTEFATAITVTVPYDLEYGADPADIAVWYIDDNGKLTSIKATYSVVEGQGYATFTTNHFSYYTVVRLSAKERCALYGCEERVTVVAPTCETDGYTLTKCIRCNKSTRSAFVKALKHEYTTNTVSATCTAKGYTTYTCTRENCGYSYATNWTETVAHNYEATVVAPTCTAKGYTVHTCKVCADAYVDTYVDAKGHAYAEGTCTACGKADPSYVEADQINFYFNAIEGLLNANSYYLEMKDVEIDVTNVYYHISGLQEELDVDNTFVQLENVQLEIAFDEKGYLAGKGISNVYVESNDLSGTVNAQVALYNGNVYMVANLAGSGFESSGAPEEMNMVVSQDALLAQAGMSVETIQGALQSVGQMEDVVAILEGIKNTPNSPLNRIITDIMEYVYTKTETVDGYHFELNFNRVEEVYDILTTKTVSETFDLVMGEGAYNQVVTYLTATIDKNVSVVVEDLTTALDLYGINIENVYNLINMMSGGEEDIREMIAQASAMKVSEFLDAMTGVEEPGSVDYKAMITQYSTQLKDMPVMEFVAMLAENMGGNVGSENVAPDSNYGEVVDKEDVPTVKKRAEEEPQYNTMYLMLMEVVDMLKKSSFSFDTDKTGELLNYTAKLSNLGEMGSVEERIEQFKQETLGNYDGEGGYGRSTSFMSFSGTIVFKPNGSFVATTDSLIQMGEDMHAVANGYFAQIKAGKLEPEDGESIVVDLLDGEMYSDVQIYHEKYYEGLGEETYAGQQAFKFRAYANLEIAADPALMIQKQSDCLAWDYYDVMGWDYYGEVTVWMNEDGEYIGIELDEGNGYNGFITIAGFYYNSTTGKYDVNWNSDGKHNFIEIEHKVAVGCEGEGYHKYSCTLCGKVEVDYYTNGHETNGNGKLILVEGATSCEGGVYMAYYCQVCGEIADSWYYGKGHYTITMRKVIGETDCGSLVMVYEACACGKEMRFNYMEGGCNFDRVEEEWLENPDDKTESAKHYLETYRCSVTDCAYTYTIESYHEAVGCEWYEYATYRFGVKEGSDDVDYTFNTKRHNGTQHLGWKDESYTDETGMYHAYTYCTSCNETFHHYDARYNEWGDTIYYKDYLTGYGYTREYFTRCEYVEYSLEGEYWGEGNHHNWYGWYPYSESCTQYQYEGEYRYCPRCGEEYYEGGYYRLPNEHRYEYNEYLGTYVCTVCGMKNQTGANDNFVIEDLTYTTENGAYTIGYYNKAYVEYSVYVVVNYGIAGDKILDMVSCADRVTYENSGIITVNMAQLEEAIKALKAEGVRVQTISVVMQYWDAQSGNYDETTGEWEGSYIDCIITFEDESGNESGDKDER